MRLHPYSRSFFDDASSLRSIRGLNRAARLLIVSATEANPALPKLLLVEDDETFAEELSTYLVAHSFEVHLSRSLEEAFESLSALAGRDDTRPVP